MSHSSSQRVRRGRDFGILIGLILSALLICLASGWLMVDSLQGERSEPFSDVTGITVQPLVELEGERAFPEAITIGPDEFIYSGSYCTGEIWRISPQGELAIWLPADAGIGAVSGLAFGPDGSLYVIDRASCDPRRSVSTLKRVLPDKTVQDFGTVTDDEILKELAFDSQGRLYVTDTQLAQVRRFDEQGNAEVWWEMPENPNKAQPRGMAYDPQQNALIVADTRNGLIYRMPITENGAVGEYSVLYEDANHSLDGLTLDETGRVIFTSYDEDSVLRLEADGSTTRLATDFRDPSDVAYLDGKVYVTNFDSVSLAPVVSLLLDPMLPFTIDVIDLTGELDSSQDE
jgi:sugar lactone lactonase YvrE